MLLCTADLLPAGPVVVPPVYATWIEAESEVRLPAAGQMQGAEAANSDCS